ncbi:unnamed protein product [Amoebophrya sp. A25]|nr:unnamed protein product [Amoebophrya sp. A25]|eukprot:GSA25T00000019001.1
MQPHMNFNGAAPGSIDFIPNVAGGVQPGLGPGASTSGLPARFAGLNGGAVPSQPPAAAAAFPGGGVLSQAGGLPAGLLQASGGGLVPPASGGGLARPAEPGRPPINYQHLYGSGGAAGGRGAGAGVGLVGVPTGLTAPSGLVGGVPAAGLLGSAGLIPGMMTGRNNGLAPTGLESMADPAINPGLYENHQLLSSARQISFAATELTFYQNLHSMVQGADPISGEIQGGDGAAFLAKSGLPKSMLHQIWQLADINETGKLNVEEFYIALRLVAHAQNLGLVHPELIHTEPQTLPSFEGLGPRRSVSECSDPDTANTSVVAAGEGELDVLGTNIDPQKILESSARREEQHDFLAKAQHSMNFNVTEQTLYQKIFETLDPENGEITGSNKKVSEFLESSGIPRHILHELWATADEEGTGKLNRLQTFILLRLIAHSQAVENGMPSPDVQFVEPPSLPLFDPSTVLGLGTAISAPSLQRAGAFYCEPMTKKDKKKYAAIFAKTDENSDGFVEGDEAKLLMQRSKLPNEFLALTWQLSDHDNDGRLNLAEFLVAMHLITRCKKGDFRPEELADLPSIEDVMPAHLETILTTDSDVIASEIFGKNLDTEQVTPSSSVAVNQPSLDGAALPTTPGALTPQLESLVARSPEISYLQAAAANAGTVPTPQNQRSAAQGLPTTSNPAVVAGVAGSAASASASAPFSNIIAGVGPASSSRASPKGSSRVAFLGSSGAAASAKQVTPPSFVDQRAPPSGIASAAGLPPETGKDPNLPSSIASTGARSAGLERLPRFGAGTGPEETVSATYLEDIAEADKRLARRAQQEVDAMEETLRTLNDKFEMLERDVRSAQREIERKSEQIAEREREKGFLKQRLNTLVEERRALTVSAFSASSTSRKGYFADETAYLEEAIQGQVYYLENAKEANVMLEKQFHQADAHLEQLERQRRELEKESTMEKEALKREERENSTLKITLDTLQRKISVVNTNLALQQAEGSGAGAILTTVPNLGAQRFPVPSSSGNIGSGGFSSGEFEASRAAAAGFGAESAASIRPPPSTSAAGGVGSGADFGPGAGSSRKEASEELAAMGGHSWSGFLIGDKTESGVKEQPTTGAAKPRSVLPRVFEREGV